MINLSQKNVVKMAKETNFIKDNVEKVMRLADILEFVFTSKWKDKLVLKGGTAINLFYRELPRLSVDIDLDYIGDTKEEMEKDKEELWHFLQMALFQKNYSLSPQSKWYRRRNPLAMTHSVIPTEPKFPIQQSVWSR